MVVVIVIVLDWYCPYGSIEMVDWKSLKLLFHVAMRIMTKMMMMMTTMTKTLSWSVIGITWTAVNVMAVVVVE